MARVVGIGHQDFEQLIQNHYFYIDKTDFIKEWWENGDAVTLITRPRRFGKTLTIRMVEQFFSVEYENRGDLFQGLSIWNDPYYHTLQGTYPVISLSFSNVKERDYSSSVLRIGQLLTNLYHKNSFLLQGDFLSEQEKEEYRMVSMDMPEVVATMAIYKMTEYLYRYYGKKVIILLDEYDAPMQEAYVGGYWEELVIFIRSLFHSTFKTNPWLERAIMTGITRVSKESVFSDLNNLEVVTTTSGKYGNSFGFTEKEVFDAMDEFGLNEKEKVKDWYDGFIFGEWSDIYNPWSILNFFDKRKFATYWANTSSNSLVGKLIREGSREIKETFERLLRGEHLFLPIEEQIIYEELDHNEYAIWSLLLASGYLKVLSYEEYDRDAIFTVPKYELALTNYEVSLMFKNMIRGWFAGNISDYNDFLKALLCGNKKAMNTYMNKVALTTFRFFDTGKKPSKESEPERFYHGFVLGLMVDLADRYWITSNRESGFGRYDVMLEPYEKEDCAIILEFKVYDPEEEHTLQDTVQMALQQIEERKYASILEAKGIASEKIRKYGFAFEGKRVLIG